MDLKALTLDQFLGTINRASGLDDEFHKLEGLATLWPPGSEQPLADHPGYAIAPLQTDVPLGTDAVLLHDVEGSFEPVGAYIGELLAIRADHQRKGLGVELVLAAVPYRSPPEKRTVSDAGLAVLKKAWAIAQAR